MTKPKPSKLAEYRLAVGSNGNLHICVKAKPHLMYSLDAFQSLIRQGLIVA